MSKMSPENWDLVFKTMMSHMDKSPKASGELNPALQTFLARGDVDFCTSTYAITIDQLADAYAKMLGYSHQR